MRKVIVNSTPLIALSHVGQLDLLKKIYSDIMIPDAVYKEMCMKGIYLSERVKQMCLKAVGEIE